MRFLMMALVAGCGVESVESGSVEVAESAELAVVEITADQVADGAVEIALADDVVYLIDGDVLLEDVRVVTDAEVIDLASLVGETVAPGETVVFGNQVAMDLYYGTPDAGMQRMPGCWWEYLQGEGWVRFCIA